MTTTATPPTLTRPCACWTRIDPTTHGGHCCFGLEAPEDCHDDVIAERLGPPAPPASTGSRPARSATSSHRPSPAPSQT